MDYIKQLYYDKLETEDIGYTKEPEYVDQIHKQIENERKLRQYVSDNDSALEWLNCMEDAQSRVTCLAVCEKFAEGFRLGAGIMLDTFVLPK